MSDVLDGVRNHYHATDLTERLEGRLGIVTAVFEAASTNT
jgi:hypothetical protein